MNYDKGTKSYKLNNFVFWSTIIGLVLLAATVAMLIVVLAVGVNTVESVNSETIGNLLSASLPEDEIGAMVKRGVRDLLQDEKALAPFIQGISKAISDELAKLLLQQQLGAFSYAKVKKSNSDTCNGITDQTTCRDAKNVCTTLQECANTANMTLCQTIGRKVHELCLRI